MYFKSLLFLLVITVIVTNETNASILKLKLLKAKAIAFKAPHIAAKLSVAKEIRDKAKDAADKTAGALKATKGAIVSVVTAPFKIAKKAIHYKVSAIKAAKVAKVAKVGALLVAKKKLLLAKKAPVFVPVPVPYKLPVPFKLPIPVPFKFPVPLKVAEPAVLPVPTLPIPTFLNGGVKGLLSGASSLIKTAGATLGVGKIAPQAEPVYRFVPDGGFSNKVEYDPRGYIPSSYGSATSYVPAIPHSEYGLPTYS